MYFLCSHAWIQKYKGCGKKMLWLGKACHMFMILRGYPLIKLAYKGGGGEGQQNSNIG